MAFLVIYMSICVQAAAFIAYIVQFVKLDPRVQFDLQLDPRVQLWK